MSTMSAADVSAQLPVGYTIRPPLFDDLSAVVELLAACDVDDYGEARETEETVGDHWRPMTLADEARIVLDSEGTVVGYADQGKRNPVRLPGYACVHPNQIGQGIGTALIEWVEWRAGQRTNDAPEGAKVRLQLGAEHGNERASRLLEEHGFAIERSFQRMVIELREPLTKPKWPPGIEVRQYVKGPDDKPTWQAVDEAFDDHWGNVRSSFEEWSTIYEREAFDASLWFLAIAGGEIAGASLCSNRDEMGWVGSLSVRRPWRHQGLAIALLHHTFAEFYRRGQRKIGLGVDSSSLTGATRVYERAGMHADQHTVLYTKVLRDGVELATESLEA